MAVYVGSARIDENGKAYGGMAGDQKGKEVSRQKYYVHSKGWRVFRAKDRSVALKIADAMDAACDNAHVGYDQWQRNDLYTCAKAVGFDIKKVTRDCETDCSALVRVCCAFAGITDIPSTFRTGNMPENLMATGAFTELTGDGYTRSSRHLGRGDILVTNGHTVVMLDDGYAYRETPAVYAPGERLLRNGCEGEDVRAMQRLLIELGYDCGTWGPDGDFGDATEMALRAFQTDAGIVSDGEYGPVTHAALMAAADSATEADPDIALSVRISGGNCWIRSGAGTAYSRLGVAANGSVHPFAGVVSDTGWLKIAFGDTTGWVSGKYGRLE